MKIFFSKKKLDCPKGELDKKKFLTVYQEFFPRGKSEKFSNEVFRLFDTDNSGKIDFTEFLVAISTSDKGDIKTKLHLAFNLYDSSNFSDKYFLEIKLFS